MYRSDNSCLRLHFTPVTSGARRVPRVPQEMVDMVIDELGRTYQRSALAACSLTCRDWLPRSKIHIHSSVRIDSCSNIERLTKLYDSHLARYVRSLSIDACVDGEPAAHPWTDNARPLLRLFPNVDRLALDAIIWQDLHKDTQKIILEQYPSVSDLWASTCDFADPCEFVKLLQAFPKLESVRLEGMCWDTSECEKQLANNGPELRLKWLDVNELCKHPSVVAKWASRYRTSVQIENIHFSLGCDHPRELDNLLQLAGSSVKTLSLGFFACTRSFTHMSMTLHPFLNLKYNTSLQSLRLSLRLESHDQVDMSWFPEILSQLNSNHLTQVTFYVEILFCQQLEWIDWNEVDEFLSQPKLKGLMRVELCLWRRSSHANFDDNDHDIPIKFKKHLPKLQEHGILYLSQQFN
ncbi:uncharacterized protein LAESUDRAFT_708102 [Laetiporus sulphureus 93-53]|uniref:F-box domain-containing protein n=1 Tax=Laetiporus sulphureus 93-53 TaxID=1314785 RepID=A0A165BG97_9APHY|nr:uncharacterized protein LAESUDRAFT_708102 [Laetiporus sulphureus 93-53]KZT01001.1 hypothetical protein LAESUDRAFT_708102 [Laetiporus sulphureus 93-53]